MVRWSSILVLLVLVFPLVAQDPVPSQPHRWKNVQIVGGGFVTGIIHHPRVRDLTYARTDMGGGYRLDPRDGSWIPLMDFMRTYQETGVESIALDPNDGQRVYFAVGTDAADWAGNGRLHRSTDQGRTWEILPLPFRLAANAEGRSIGERLTVDPHDGRILYFATRLAGLWRSTDRGTTWTRMPSFPNGSQGKPFGLGVVICDPRTGGPGKACTTLLVGGTSTQDPTLWRSTDGGASWQAVPGQPSGLIIHHLALVADGSLYLTCSDGPGPNGITRGAVWAWSTSSGTWMDISPVPGQGFGYGGLGVQADDPQVLVVSSLCRWGPKDDLWRSRDGGRTWKSILQAGIIDTSRAPYYPAPHWIGEVAIDPGNPRVLRFTTGGGIYRCENLDACDRGDRARFSVGAVGLEETFANDLLCPPAGAQLLSGINDVAGFRHEDVTIPPPEGAFTHPRFMTTRLDVAEGQPDLVVRVGPSKTYLAFSADNGRTWRPLPVPDQEASSSHSVAIGADGGMVAVVPDRQDGKALWTTHDLGVTWRVALPAGSGVSQVLADRVDPRRCYALGVGDGAGSREARWYRSDDGGRTFSSTTVVPRAERARIIRATPGQRGHVWIPAEQGGLLRSTDGGDRFQRVAALSTCFTVGFGKAAEGATYPAIYATGTIGGVYGVFRSDDGAETWVRINDDHHRFGDLCYSITGDPRRYGRVYVATNGRGIVYADPVAP